MSPNFWVNPQNRVNYRVAVQTPRYQVDSVDALMNTPIINGRPYRQPGTAANRPHARAPVTGHADRGAASSSRSS